MRTELHVTNDVPTAELIAMLESVGDVKVVAYTVGVLERVFILEEVQKPDPYRDLGFTHDFSFNGVGAYQRPVMRSRKRPW